MEATTSIETDPHLEAEGVWNEYGDVFRVKLARAGGSNAVYVDHFWQRVGPLVDRIDANKVGEAEATKVIRQLLIKQLIKGWQTQVGGQWRDGIAINDAGTVLPATRKNLQRRLAEWPKLVLELWKHAQDANAYRVRGDQPAGVEGESTC